MHKPSPADKFIFLKIAPLFRVWGPTELFSCGCRVPAMAVLFRLACVVEQLGKWEHFMVMLIYLMFVDSPRVSSGWTTDMAANLRKGRGQLWWREGAVATSLEPWFESELLFFKVLLT